MFGIMQFPCAIIVEYVTKYIWIPIEEIFFAILVVEELTLIRAEQCVWIFLECVAPSLEASPRYIDQQFLIVRFAAILGHGRRG